MDAKEYAAWKAETKKSEGRWIIDPVTLWNQGASLYYHGGTSGQYLLIQADGSVEIGTYEDALPHIGEAIFRPIASAKVGKNAYAARMILSSRFRAHGLDDLAVAIEQPDYAHP